MFAYCLNNPVNGCDPCGTCFHRWDFWNDCEKCGGKTIGDKWEVVTTWCTEAYDTINSVHQRQVQLETQIIMQQNEILADTATNMWNAYVYSVEMQAEMQYQQDMVIVKTVEFTKAHPILAIDIAAASVGLAGVYCAAISLAGVSVPVSLSVIINTAGHVATLWGAYRTFTGAWEEWMSYIGEE